MKTDWFMIPFHFHPPVINLRKVMVIRALGDTELKIVFDGGYKEVYEFKSKAQRQDAVKELITILNGRKERERDQEIQPASGFLDES